MPGLVPGIHVFRRFSKQDVDARHSPGMTVSNDVKRYFAPQNIS